MSEKFISPSKNLLIKSTPNPFYGNPLVKEGVLEEKRSQLIAAHEELRSGFTTVAQFSEDLLTAASVYYAVKKDMELAGVADTIGAAFHEILNPSVPELIVMEQLSYFPTSSTQRSLPGFLLESLSSNANFPIAMLATRRGPYDIYFLTTNTQDGINFSLGPGISLREIKVVPPSRRTRKISHRVDLGFARVDLGGFPVVEPSFFLRFIPDGHVLLRKAIVNYSTLSNARQDRKMALQAKS